MKHINYIVVLTLIGIFQIGCRPSESGNISSYKADTELADSTTSESIKRFESEIRAFELEDDSTGHLKDVIIFTGSSSIRMWSTLNSDMAGYHVINRGFGGATTPELSHYAPRFLYHHSPSALVFYCGENDISEGASPEAALNSFKVFYSQFRKEWPELPFVYLFMKPSPARWSLWDKCTKANNSIVSFLESQNNNYFLDVGELMLNEKGRPDPMIFISDSLHMNYKGYQRWTEALRPLLSDLKL